MPLADLTLELDGDSFDVAGRRAGLLLLLALILSFAFIRMSTRLMRNPKVTWWPGSIETGGGLHIHHLVFGIVLLMLAGFLAFALQPDSPWLEILAVAFGIGAGLTLDEFALWLHLEDVYWSEEGRSSVDAVIIATMIGGAFVVGLAPLDGGEDGSAVALVATVMINLGVCALAALKGKVWSALAGMFFPPVAYVAAIRVALPGSFWARRRYSGDSKKLAEAKRRGERHDRRLRRIQDLIGGKPSTELAD